MIPGPTVTYVVMKLREALVTMHFTPCGKLFDSRVPTGNMHDQKGLHETFLKKLVPGLWLSVVKEDQIKAQTWQGLDYGKQCRNSERQIPNLLVEFALGFCENADTA